MIRHKFVKLLLRVNNQAPVPSSVASANGRLRSRPWSRFRRRVQIGSRGRCCLLCPEYKWRVPIGLSAHFYTVSLKIEAGRYSAFLMKSERVAWVSVQRTRLTGMTTWTPLDGRWHFQYWEYGTFSFSLYSLFLFDAYFLSEQSHIYFIRNIFIYLFQNIDSVFLWLNALESLCSCTIGSVQ